MHLHPTVRKVITIILIGIVVTAGSYIYWLRQVTTTETTTYSSNEIPVIELKGAIDGNGARLFINSLGHIANSRANAMIILVDTPGGELDAGLRVSEYLLKTKIKTLCIG